MDDVATRLRGVAPAAFNSVPVLFAYLFGSHAARTATPRSDIDVAVYCHADDIDTLALRLRLAATLEQLAGSSGPGLQGGAGEQRCLFGGVFGSVEAGVAGP